MDPAQEESHFEGMTWMNPHIVIFAQCISILIRIIDGDHRFK